jgi:hypothetical protein
VDIGSKATILLTGSGLIALGGWVLWWVSRYDLKGLALESLFQVLTRRRTPENPTSLEHKWREIARQPSAFRKARRAAWTIAGHLVAPTLTIAALALILIGLAVVGFGLLWG